MQRFLNLSRLTSLGTQLVVGCLMLLLTAVISNPAVGQELLIPPAVQSTTEFIPAPARLAGAIALHRLLDCQHP